jgi:hypothetical protein
MQQAQKPAKTERNVCISALSSLRSRGHRRGGRHAAAAQARPYVSSGCEHGLLCVVPGWRCGAGRPVNLKGVAARCWLPLFEEPNHPAPRCLLPHALHMPTPRPAGDVAEDIDSNLASVAAAERRGAGIPGHHRYHARSSCSMYPQTGQTARRSNCGWSRSAG